MELSAIALAIVLTSQAAQPAMPAAAPSATRPTPNDLAAEAVRLPSEKVAKYRDVTLTEVLVAAPRDANQRLIVVQAYWRLWQAFADRAMGQQLIAHIEPVLQRTKADTVDATLLDAELASAKARYEEAEVAVRAAQLQLCGLLGWNASGTMPRPLDPPHVGTYHTQYKAIYARRAPTDRVLLIHETLPIYHHALGARGVSQQAAGDVVVEQQSGYEARQITVETLISAWLAQAQQQRELCRVAWEYNKLIAEYAVPLAGQDMEAPRLVGMLIRPAGAQASRRPGSRADATNTYDDAVEPAGFDRPVEAASEADPEAIEWEASNSEQPQPPYTDYGNEVDGATEDAVVEPEEQAPLDNDQEVDEATQENGVYPDEFPDAEPVDDPFKQNEVRREISRRHFAAKPVVAPLSNAIFANMPTTTAAPSAVIETMFRRTEVWDQGEEAVNLRKCLAATSATRYAELLDAYLLAWQAATNYQAGVDAAAQLQAVKTTLLSRLNDPSAAADMLVLRAAETAIAAEMVECEAEIWRNAAALGAIALPLASGKRALPSEDPPTWATATGGPAAKATNARTQSLVAMDRARTRAMKEYAAGGPTFGLTLQAIRRQNEETRAFADLVASSGQERGRAILAQHPSANADMVRQALLGTSNNMARPGGLQFRKKTPTP